MKVLFIHIYYTNAITSGASAIVFSLWNFLKNNGHEPYIFATDEKPYIDDNYPYTKYFPKGISNLDKNTISGYFKRLFIKVYNKEAKKNIEKMLDEIKPDIVHIHSVWELSYSLLLSEIFLLFIQHMMLVTVVPQYHLSVKNVAINTKKRYQNE